MTGNVQPLLKAEIILEILSFKPCLTAINLYRTNVVIKFFNSICQFPLLHVSVRQISDRLCSSFSDRAFSAPGGVFRRGEPALSPKLSKQAYTHGRLCPW